jgi:DNA-directed RNA polymerase subunit RPC12/RpoP
VERVTGMSWDAASEKGLVRYAIQALCLRCAEVFDAEYKQDEQLEARCPKCGVANARSVLDSAGARCPQCHEGILRRVDIGVA